MLDTNNGQLCERLPAATITGPQTLLFAASTGIIVTNLFAPQTLVGLIGPSLGASAANVGLVAMATLLGYAAGLFFLVPMADLAENRALILRMLLTAALAAGGFDGGVNNARIRWCNGETDLAHVFARQSGLHFVPSVAVIVGITDNS